LFTSVLLLSRFWFLLRASRSSFRRGSLDPHCRAPACLAPSLPLLGSLTSPPGFLQLRSLAPPAWQSCLDPSCWAPSLPPAGLPSTPLLGSFPLPCLARSCWPPSLPPACLPRSLLRASLGLGFCLAPACLPPSLLYQLYHFRASEWSSHQR
jgi:hypothetical protein